ncbi:MAG: autotransporter assembly complex protein TamA, partial [Panacagrimonas sp.]
MYFFPGETRLGLRSLRPLLGVAALLLSLNASAGLKVEVNGLKGRTLSNVKARLAIEQLSKEKSESPPSARQVRRLHRKAEAQIREAMQVYGYYAPNIETRLEQQDENWLARYDIVAGKPTRIQTLDAGFEGEGAAHPALLKALQELPLKPGKSLRHDRYASAKQQMSRAAREAGFLDARWIAHEMRVYPQRHAAELELRIDTGPRYFFGEIAVQQEQLRPRLIKRYLPIEAGQPFSRRALLDTQFLIADLGYFNTVEVEPQFQTRDGEQQVPIVVRTTPLARTRYDFGAGYGTDTGARLSVGADRRWVNRRGHRLNTDMRLSEIKNTLAAEYLIPVGQTIGENLSLTAVSETERLENGDTLKYVLGASFNRSPGDWQRRWYLEYTHEESDFGETKAIADLLTPGLSINRSRNDDPIHTRRGWYVFVDVHGAQEGVLANSSFLQTRALLRGVYPLFGERGRVIARAEMGASFVQAFRELPASQRFFAGGDQSVRGYAYQSLAPRDEDGNVIGGRYLSAFSLETEYRVFGNWGAALFVDSGGAADD